MRLGNDYQHVTINACSDGTLDFSVGVDVRVAEFAAAIGVVVAESDWLAFMKGLVELDTTRRGVAVLQSAITGELLLQIYSMDSAGHMAVAGHIERLDLPSRPRLAFDAIEFDATLLPAFVAKVAAA